MNEITLLNYFIINHFKDNDLVNTVSIVPTFEMDKNKENIYPLVNIDLQNTDIETDSVIASYQITVVTQREISNVKTDSKLLNDSNYLDNLNNCHAIVAKFINFLNLQNNDLNIEIQSLSKNKVLNNTFASGLDGFQFDVELSIHNSGRS